MSSLGLLLLLTLSANLVSSELLMESGYSITTVIDFNKPLSSDSSDVSAINPFALNPLTRSDNLLILLDYTKSTFYSLDLPLSQESRVRLLSGKRIDGFSDGDASAAMFKHPRSFAVDSNDNIYVADGINHAIRKISGVSGVTTTIAGGYSNKTGHTDGSAQNATFSDNFDLLFMPKMCSLLISDRGNRLIRQMDLKPEDCQEKPQSSKGLGAISVSIIAVLALLSGLAFGFIARPFVTPNSSEPSASHCILHSWNHMKPTLMLSSGIRSVVASSKTLNLLFRLLNFSLGYMRVVFSNIRLTKLVHCKEPVLLLDADFVSGNQKLKLQELADGKKDLIDFEEELSVLNLSFSTNEHVGTEEVCGRNIHEIEDEGSLNGKIDNMMVTNLMDFTTQIKQRSLIKRRLNSAHDFSL